MKVIASSVRKGNILDIDGKAVKADLDAGKVVVVAGFQGIDGLHLKLFWLTRRIGAPHATMHTYAQGYRSAP